MASRVSDSGNQQKPDSQPLSSKTSKPSSSEPTGAITSIMTQDISADLYAPNKLFNYTINASLLLVGIIICLFIGCFILRAYQTKPLYYFVNEDKAYPMTALDQPNLTTNAVLHWATNAATSALTFNFYNYPQILKDVKVYFTPAGYDNFLAALKAAGTIQTIVKKQLAVYAVQTGNPIILNEGIISTGVYAWQIQFPMIITYESERESKQAIILTLLVSRVPTSESTTGIGISSFVVAEARQT